MSEERENQEEKKTICDYFLNIFDKEKLKPNITLLSLFILLWESFRAMVIRYPRSFFSKSNGLENEQIKINDDEYKKNVLILDKRDKFKASLLWFENLGAISKEEIDFILKIRENRNRIVHEMVDALVLGVQQEDVCQLTALIKYYRKIDIWYHCNMDTPIVLGTPDINLEKINQNEIVGGYSAFLESIVDIALGNGDKYEEVLNLLKGVKEKSY